MGNRRMTAPKRRRDRLSSAPKPRPAHRPRSKQEGSFARWLDASPLTADEIAERLHISTGYLFNLRVGNRKPGRDVAVAIEELSEGLVPVACWS